MAYADMNVTCRECGSEFLFTAFEQEFYAINNYSYEIECCQDCRRKHTVAALNTVRHTVSETPSPRPMREVPCALCGKTTAISFAPRFGRPVYCNDCYEERASRHGRR